MLEIGVCERRTGTVSHDRRRDGRGESMIVVGAEAARSLEHREPLFPDPGSHAHQMLAPDGHEVVCHEHKRLALVDVTAQGRGIRPRAGNREPHGLHRVRLAPDDRVRTRALRVDAGLVEAALNDLQIEFRLAREKIDTSLEQSERSTLLAGAVLVEILIENAGRISNKVSNIRMLVELQRSSQDSLQGSGLVGSQLTEHARQLADLRRLEATYLQSLRSALEVLSREIGPDARNAAYSTLRKDLRGSEQTQFLMMLDRFWQDLIVYEQRSELTASELLQTVLN